jgi:hypothetical protein
MAAKWHCASSASHITNVFFVGKSSLLSSALNVTISSEVFVTLTELHIRKTHVGAE